jgi:stage V sporulation protein G|tara:strand:- start:17487 stop:17765 length:279 start_codon:yes stop_codon:yes gene_type:complete
MKIKDMRTGNWGKIVAFFTIVTAEGFEIKGCKLVDGANGLFVSAPQEKNPKNDEYYDTVWIPKEVRPELEKLASESYSPVKGETVNSEDIPF